MKLLSFVHKGRETWGAVVDEGVVDLGQTMKQYATLAEYIASDAYLDADHDVKGRAIDAKLADITFLPVIPRPEKIICALRNYVDPQQYLSATVSPSDTPAQPPIFLRVWRSQCAHKQPIVRPRVSDLLDWEGELAVIIGKGGRDIAVDDAFDHVAGYACYNDASVRDWQSHAKQIAAGKNFESTGAFGPWMVTADEIDPGRHLKIEVRLNNEVVQSSHTGYMIFGIPKLINYASTIFTLSPGDVIVTGTPGGVGWTRKPPRYMKPGDICEVEIEGIGILRNSITTQA